MFLMFYHVVFDTRQTMWLAVQRVSVKKKGEHAKYKEKGSVKVIERIIEYTFIYVEVLSHCIVVAWKAQ